MSLNPISNARVTIVVIAFSVILLPRPIRAWDYEGHRLINQLALASLPEEFPDFVKTPEATDRIAFLAGEADRWRNSPDLPLKHFNAPDHFLDFEYLEDYGLESETLSPFRYEFVAQMASARALRKEDFPIIEPDKDKDRTKALIGFLPWTITEYQSKLKSAFSYLKVFEDLGNEEEIANAQRNIIYLMGVMGHFVGDGAQPLHTTLHYNGWTGDNPEEFTTSRRFHAWIDGGFIKEVPLNTESLFEKLRPAKSIVEDGGTPEDTGEFYSVVTYLTDQFEEVRPLYELEKSGAFDSDSEHTAEGKKFLEGQMLAGAQMLGDLWMTAWEEAHKDSYLQRKLEERRSQSSEGE